MNEMKATTIYGYKCPKCGSTIDIGVMIDSDNVPKCSKCNIPLIPDPNGKISAVNVYCPKCRITYGIVNSDRCPKCGGSFSKA